MREGVRGSLFIQFVPREVLKDVESRPEYTSEDLTVGLFRPINGEQIGLVRYDPNAKPPPDKPKPTTKRKTQKNDEASTSKTKKKRKPSPSSF